MTHCLVISQLAISLFSSLHYYCDPRIANFYTLFCRQHLQKLKKKEGNGTAGAPGVPATPKKPKGAAAGIKTPKTPKSAGKRKQSVGEDEDEEKILKKKLKQE